MQRKAPFNIRAGEKAQLRTGMYGMSREGRMPEVTYTGVNEHFEPVFNAAMRPSARFSAGG